MPMPCLSTRTLLSSAVLLMLLTACGGGGGDEVADAGTYAASPVYRLTPALLAEPPTIDADGQEGSALLAPTELQVDAAGQALDAQAPVPDEWRQALQDAASRRTALTAGRVEAFAAAVSASVYTPAQIRAAYGLASLPAATSVNRGAYQGSGQTIYILTAGHNPNVANDLAVFNQRFGLDGCTSLTVSPSAALPLAPAAAGSGCSLAVVFAAAAAANGPPTGMLTSRVPAISKAWVTESTLDVQWAHAIAPKARLVLIEAQSALVSDLMAAVALANRMGPGIVSMSLGVPEFAAASMTYWGAPLGGASMTYVAANGDYGSQVNWPAVDPRVLAVGGTRLSWDGATRSEAAWSSTGGGTSRQVLAPAYQANLVKPGETVSTRVRYRGSADVAFNADPYSGQYVYVTPSSATGGTGWISAGGTSIGAPQWAGLLAIGNAVRALNNKAPLGTVHTRLYASATGGGYSALFADVTQGRNGSCGAMCNASAGYDLLTGWGTPKGPALINALTTY